MQTNHDSEQHCEAKLSQKQTKGAIEKNSTIRICVDHQLTLIIGFMSLGLKSSIAICSALDMESLCFAYSASKVAAGSASIDQCKSMRGFKSL